MIRLATQEKIGSLERFIAQNPALADVPVLTISGRPTTLREALNYLRLGTNVNEILSGLLSLGIDAPWQLCQEFYRRLAAARPELKIMSLSFVPPISPAEALSHVEAHDEIGRSLVEKYAELLSFIKTRVN